MIVFLSVPQDFSYLSERSVLRAVVDFISEAGKKGEEKSYNCDLTIRKQNNNKII